jgi:hypothetical protein
MLLLRLDDHGPVDPDIPRRFLEEYFVGCEGSQALQEEGVLELLEAVRALADPSVLWLPSRYAEVPERAAVAG